MYTVVLNSGMKQQLWEYEEVKRKDRIGFSKEKALIWELQKKSKAYHTKEEILNTQDSRKRDWKQKSEPTLEAERRRKVKAYCAKDEVAPTAPRDDARNTTGLVQMLDKNM